MLDLINGNIFTNRRSSDGALRRPSAFCSRCHYPQWEVVFVAPSSTAFRDTIEGDESIVSFVVRLLCGRRPFTIRQPSVLNAFLAMTARVVKVIVLSLHREVAQALSHVGQKVREVLPSFANPDSSLGVFDVVTNAVFDSRPNGILGSPEARSGSAMRGIRLARYFPAQTPAGLCFSANEMPGKNLPGLAAFAGAYPIRLIVNSIPNV